MNTLSNHTSNRNQNLPRGGQATIGLFGMPGGRRFDASPAAPPKPSPIERRMAERRGAALATESRLARLQARLAPAKPDRDALFEEETPRPTAAMSRAALAADMREVYFPLVDDEQADLARRACGAGYVEAALNGEGF